MFWLVLFMLLVGHFVADFALQSDSMAVGKNRRLASVSKSGVPWPYWLAAHSFIHGGAVTFMTGSMYLGVAETVFHAFIDHLKTEGLINVHVDQFLHVLCKVVWAGVVAFFASLALPVQ